jgi:hypothetical protein
MKHRVIVSSTSRRPSSAPFRMVAYCATCGESTPQVSPADAKAWAENHRQQRDKEPNE